MPIATRNLDMSTAYFQRKHPIFFQMSDHLYVMCTMLEEIVCPICKYAFDEPILTECEHAFCSVCIHNALRARPHCPICRKVEPKIRAAHTLRRIVKHVVFKCPKPGCHTAINPSRRSIENHNEKAHNSPGK